VGDHQPPGWLRPLLDALEAGAGGWLSAPSSSPPDGVRRAAVLVLFGEGAQGPDVLLIEKSAHLRTHAGQPAFPGGGLEPQDADAAAAALREAEEETGLDPAGVDVLAVLPQLWVPPSGNAVTPVVAWWREPSEVGLADPREVAAVARVPLTELVDPANRIRVRGPRDHVGPAFRVAGMVVWGFTAGVLDRLLELGGWALPWDESRVEPLPDATPAVSPDDVLAPHAGAG
jgi:8-oxo-dGTP pyrophosphatase MutT (NUDIX family)